MTDTRGIGFVPEGHSTTQCFNVGEPWTDAASPEGTAEESPEVSAVPSGLRQRSSVRSPNAETLGYSQETLRDEEPKSGGIGLLVSEPPSSLQAAKLQHRRLPASAAKRTNISRRQF